MMSVIRMQVWESERRLEEARSAAHRSRVCAKAREAWKASQQGSLDIDTVHRAGSLSAVLETVRQAILVTLAGLPPSHVSWGW